MVQGPLSLFSSANDWTGARTAQIERSEAGFGFAIRGNAPVLICSVDPNSPAEVCASTSGDSMIIHPCITAHVHVLRTEWDCKLFFFLTHAIVQLDM